MTELANTMLPNLPENLQWVYGVMYIVEMICFYGMLLSPFLLIFNIKRKRW